MTKLIAFIFAASLANTAFASWIAPVETGFCTRDFNEWGQASQCQCPHATRYENALGKCVQGASINVTLDGVISSVVEFEGEEPSFVLTNKTADSYELILKNMDRLQLEELKAQGLNYRLSGEILEEFDGSQTPDVPFFIVRGIEILPTFRGELTK